MSYLADLLLIVVPLVTYVPMIGDREYEEMKSAFVEFSTTELQQVTVEIK